MSPPLMIILGVVEVPSRMYVLKTVADDWIALLSDPVIQFRISTKR